jgi:hypothetical protein
VCVNSEEVGNENDALDEKESAFNLLIKRKCCQKQLIN